MDKQTDWAERERRFVEKRRENLPEDAKVDEQAPCFGLAFSGGGIRSATFSLGFAQGLAKAGAFLRFDYLSTVSGGGYIGLFLRTLFIPAALRGKGNADAAEPSETTCREQADWGLQVLCSDANDVAITSPEQGADGSSRNSHAAEPITNPIYWLREHSRYLTPNGAGDFLYVLAYLTRNWLAMQYVWVITLLPVILFLNLAMIGVADGGVVGTALDWLSDKGVSLLFMLPLLIVPLVAVAMVAYWLTEPLKGRSRGADLWAANLVTVVTIVPAALAGYFLLELDGEQPWLTGLLVGVAGVCIAAAVLFQILFRQAYKRADNSPTYELGELRRRMTKTLASCLTAFICVFAVALIDQLGMELYGALIGPSAVPEVSLTTGIALLPGVVWLIRNVPQWFGSERPGQIAGVARRYFTILLPVVGVALYAFLAVCLVTVAYFILWQGRPVVVSIANEGGFSWELWRPAFIVCGLSLILAIITGCSPGFLNLSSLHNFYSARLTRAYLGATNPRRLAAHYKLRGGAAAARVTDTHPLDGMDVQAYLQKPVVAPIHLINVTVNETVSPGNALTQRDRKGINLCIGPVGASVAGAAVEWEKLGMSAEQGGAEAISLGGWCAISGAAMGTGMGRHTSLGSALLTTFGNVRLGYWWDARAAAATARRAEKKPLRFLETQYYLLDEMRSHFVRAPGRRLHLSDGGHFENTGVYELLRRQVPVIVVCDNGADPSYHFGDFANLVRTARLDFGAEITALTRRQIMELPGFPQRLCRHFGTVEDFRCTDPAARPELCALLCRVVYDHDSGPRMGWMVIVKPLVIQVAADVEHYADTNPDFPQQTTGDQFFDEAQWESYRYLGEVIASRLFARDSELLRWLEKQATG